MCGNDSYTGFAYVYDRFMDNVPYRAWAKQTYELLKKEGIYTGIVADLGCGTGVFTMLMSDYGYDMIGIDSSEDMLGVAMEKKCASQYSVSVSGYAGIRAVRNLCRHCQPM